VPSYKKEARLSALAFFVFENKNQKELKQTLLSFTQKKDLKEK